MRCSIVSDLHLEMCVSCTLPGGDLLLLAGDCFGVEAYDLRKQDDAARRSRGRQQKFAQEQLSKYTHVVDVCGNHTFYGSLFEESVAKLRAFFAEYAPNTTLLDNEMIEIDGVRILGTTLWGRNGVNKPAEWLIRNAMRDFTAIRTLAEPLGEQRWAFPPGTRRAWEPKDAAHQHELALAFLEAAPTELPTVLLTHHAPSFQSSHGHEYGTPYLDEAYCANLVDFLHRRPNIKLAVHGHTHHPEHYRIGETLVVSNPRGYFPHERRSRHFDPQAEDFDWEDLKS